MRMTMSTTMALCGARQRKSIELLIITVQNILIKYMYMSAYCDIWAYMLSSFLIDQESELHAYMYLSPNCVTSLVA